MNTKVLVVGSCRIENILYAKTYPVEDSELDTDVDEEFRIGGNAVDVCRALNSSKSSGHLLTTLPRNNALFDRFLPETRLDTSLSVVTEGKPAWSTIVVNEMANTVSSFHFPGDLPSTVEAIAQSNRSLTGFSWIHIEDAADSENSLQFVNSIRKKLASEAEVSAGFHWNAIPAWLSQVDYAFVDRRTASGNRGILQLTSTKISVCGEQRVEELAKSINLGNSTVIVLSEKEVIVLRDGEEPMYVGSMRQLTAEERRRSYGTLVGRTVRLLNSGIHLRAAIESAVTRL